MFELKRNGLNSREHCCHRHKLASPVISIINGYHVNILFDYWPIFVNIEPLQT